MTLNPLILQKMNTPHHASSIEILKSIALEAGAIVRKGFAASKEITHKGTVDLVTQYDVATEQFIIEKLRAAFPEHTLIGEETHRGDFGTVFEKAIDIDPIDGTTNFVHGVPHVAISIAVYEHGEGQMGVVYNPILDELYCAVRGEGACCNGKTIHVSTQDTLQQALIATGFPYSKVEQGADYAWVMQTMDKMLPHVRDIRRLGSAALDLCYVARGTMDGYYEINLKPWDAAAGLIIAQEAGALVTSVDGSPVHFENTTVIAANPSLHQQIVQQLQ